MKLLPGLLRGASCSVFAGLLCGAASASTILVDPGGSGDYLTIQEAIDAAVDGDAIFCAAGTYVENLIVPVSVTIIGAGVGRSVLLPATSIPGTGNGSQVTTTTWMVRVQADGVILNGFSLDGDNPSLPAPIDTRGGIITDYSAGSWSGLEVINCEVRNVVYRAIYLAAGGSGHRIVSNTVANAKGVTLDSVGIFFYGAVGEASGNVVDDCSIGIGFQTGGGGLLADNEITGCDLGILANGSDSPVTFSDNSIADSAQGIQVIAVNTTVDVLGNATTSCGSGLTLFGLGSGSVVVDGNTFEGDRSAGTYGIFATTDVSPWGYGGLTFVATDNLIVDNDVGVVLHESAANVTPHLSCVLSGAADQHNTFTGSVSYNLYLESCNDDVGATHNSWGAVSPALIEETIHHQVDDPALGLVDFSNPTAFFVVVDDDGPADFTTINPAVQALLPGGTILVMPGLYVEDVLVDRSCLIQGSGTSEDPALGTILRGASTDPDLTVVEVTGPDVFIDDLRVDGQQAVYTRARRAVYGNATSGLSVTNCVVHTARTGIAYNQSTDGLFLGNEVYEFGESLQAGGGIFLWNSTGTVGLPGQGNWVHDGPATAIIFHNSSAGEAYDNLAQDAGLGYLSNGAIAPTLFEGNRAKDCDQGYQAIGNHVPVTYVDNDSAGGQWGYILFGLGGQLHTYRGNRAHGTGEAWVITTECVYGDDDAVATLEGNIAIESQYGVVLEETASSVSYSMDVNLNGLAEPNWFQSNDVLDLRLILCDDDIDARGNYFGVPFVSIVENQIHHRTDDPALGLVSYGNLTPSFAYCDPKLASAGCLPSIGSTGICRATSATPFEITATEVLSQQFGFLFYGLARNEIPFFGGALCVKGPLYRTHVQNSGGTGPADCTGTYSYDFNALVQSGGNPLLVPGASVYAQYWYRDPALGGDEPVGVTDAITFTIGP